jgi:hypothetical protein
LNSISGHPFAPVAKCENRYPQDSVTGMPDLRNTRVKVMKV